MNLSINIKGTLFDLSVPRVMGILNTTPDSFSDGGRYQSVDRAIERVAQMVDEGVNMIDVGGYSSRPGADEVPTQEELDRVVPVIEAITKRWSLPVSIDTFRSKVAVEAVEAGAHIVNDISAGDDDPDMIATVADLKVPYIAMHKQGTPKTMQIDPQYANVVEEVSRYLIKKIDHCHESGIKDVVIDPGFGFGKSVEHNYRLLKHLDQLKALNAPMLIGLSRKSMICKVLKVNPEHALNGTTFLHAFALQGGASILRVHDVKEAVEAVKLWSALRY